MESFKYLLQTTDIFDTWLDSLMTSNRALGQRVVQRMRRMSLGNLGDVKSVGDRVYEARIFSTPALRLYYIQLDGIVIVLLCGGGKDNQQKDISNAKRLATELLEELKNEANQL